MRKRHISLKGTWEYSASRLVKDGGLAVGQELSLRREPDCKYDKNAIRVFAGRSKLGYLPKNLSAEIARYLDSEGRYKAKVANIGKRTKKGTSYPTIQLDLWLHDMPEHPGVDALQRNAASFGKIRGIYRIANTVEQKSYIGSSTNIGKRLEQHLNDLLNGEHGNHLLSAAWLRHGASVFEFHLVEEIKQGDLLERERHHIARLNTYRNGYNHSSDGEGKTAAPAAKVAQIAARAELMENSMGLYDSFRSAPKAPQPPSPPPPPLAHSTMPQRGSGCLVIIIMGFIAGMAPLIPFLVS